MTIAVLRTLHAIIGEAIDDIERVYSAHESNSEASSRRETPDDASTSQDGDIDDVDAAQFILKQRTTMSSSQAYVSPPPSPCVLAPANYGLPSPITSESSRNSTGAGALLTDFPSLDAPCDLSSASEMLTAHPDVQAAIGKIVAAAGQLSATAQIPFLTLCDVTMGHHLPSCMRLLEASHVVEILREAGPGGAHVQAISDKNGVSASKLAHILRLLATHHLLREVSPDVFALNRLSSLLDTGKTFAQLKQFEAEGIPELKYRETNGISAFVGLCTDEIQKASTYMTETYYLSPSKQTREGTDPVKAPFCFAFDTARSGVGYFNWLEGDGAAPAPAPAPYPGDTADARTHARANASPESADVGLASARPMKRKHQRRPSVSVPVSSKAQRRQRNTPCSTDSESSGTVQGGHGILKSNQTIEDEDEDESAGSCRAAIGSTCNRYRLERFGKAMSGTDGWEAPGAVLNGFDWAALPLGSIVVDVGGGIGSTSMLLATAFSSPEAGEPPRVKFVIQDRPVVCEMGEKAWKEKCPKLLESTAQFQAHDFFTPQPIRNAAVFLLRVVLHDWPDDFARRILLHLREAATPDTKLVIADFILPLACPDDMGGSGGLEGIEGAESVLAPAPLLPNLGKASTNVYYMDLTMQVMFNSQERTLREMVALARSGGWKVVKVTRTPGSHLGNIVAIPMDIPTQSTPQVIPVNEDRHPSHDLGSEIETGRKYRADMEVFDRAGSRCGTPTFGSGMRLSSVEEALARFGGGLLRSRLSRGPYSPRSATGKQPAPSLKPPLNLFSAVKKKMKPSPLSVPSVPSSPSPVQSPRRLPFPSTSPRIEPVNPPSRSPGSVSAPRRVFRRLSAAHLHRSPSPPPPLPTAPGHLPPPPPSPLSSPRLGPARSLFRRASVAHLRSGSEISFDTSIPVPPLPPSFIPMRTAGTDANTLNPNGQLRNGSASSIGSSASGSRQSSIRRASTAQLPNLLQGPFRKRSGTVTAAEARTTESGAGVSARGDGGRNNSKWHSRQISEAAPSKNAIALASSPYIDGLQNRN